MSRRQSTWLSWTRCRGRNGWDAPQNIPPDMAAEAVNVDLFDGGLGRKRPGSVAIPGLSYTSLTFPFRALYSWFRGPGEHQHDLFGVDSASTPLLWRLSSAAVESTITVADAISSSSNPITFAPLNGKLYLAYDSSDNRLHVYDPTYSTTALRKAGIAAPAAPSVANTGSGSYAATIRYYRVAMTYQVSSVTVGRSNLGTAQSFTPSGSGTHARITKPTTKDHATHWEVYASDDGESYYGPIATTVVGTTTYDDGLDPATYEIDYDLAPEEGANTPFPSCKFIYSNGSRLFGLGVWESSAGDSHTPVAGTVYVTPVLDSSSVHDDERCSNTLTAVGRIVVNRQATGIERGIAGLGNMVFAFFDQGIYGLVATENPDTPYRVVKYSETVGLVSAQSLVEAEDENGRPCLYFLDPSLGPYRLGVDGLKWVGKDVFDLWNGFGCYQSAKVQAHGIYYKDRKQVWFFWTPDTSGDDPTSNDANYPSKMIVLQINEQMPDEDGDLRGGWVQWVGPTGDAVPTATVAVMHPFKDQPGFKRYKRPVVGIVSEAELWQTPGLLTDTETRDDGRNSQAYLTSRVFTTDQPIQQQAVQRTYLTALTGSATVQQTLIRNYGEESRTATVTLTASGSQTRATKPFDDGLLQDAYAVQVTLGDSAASSQYWQIDSWHAEVDPNEVR